MMTSENERRRRDTPASRGRRRSLRKRSLPNTRCETWEGRNAHLEHMAAVVVVLAQQGIVHNERRGGHSPSPLLIRPRYPFTPTDERRERTRGRGARMH